MRHRLARGVRSRARDSCTSGTGTGAELETIFEAFVQSSRTKDGAGGSGLGLAICRKIVEAHHGRIAARNADQGGAVFDVWLPRASAGERRPAALDDPGLRQAARPACRQR